MHTYVDIYTYVDIVTLEQSLSLRLHCMYVIYYTYASDGLMILNSHKT